MKYIYRSWVFLLLLAPLTLLADKGIDLGPSVVADGSVVELAEKGFSIQPPKGWLVYREYPGTTLLMQSADKDEGGFQRTIQVLTFNGPLYFDEVSAAKFEEFISHKFSESSGAIEGFKIRNRQPVTLDSGAEGYLFYSEYKVNDFPMMQMHVAVSASSRHFLMTYTDFAQHFDADAGPQARLNEAWRSIGSVQLDSSAPHRYLLPIILLAAIFFTAFFLLFQRLVLQRRMARRYDMEMKRLELEAGDAYVPVSKDPESMTPKKMRTVSVQEEIVDEAVDEYGDNEDMEFEHEKAS